MMTATNLIGLKIKTGRPSHKPSIEGALWTGTAEVTMFESGRVPAALVETSWGPMAIVRLAGCDKERDAWWDARIVPSREWETDSGVLVVDADPEIADQIDAELATATDRHYQSQKDLHARIMQGTYSIA